MNYKTQFQSPQLIWQQNSTPYSERFEDIYFTPEHGLAESDHVFVAANDLINRWKRLQDNDVFTIFECGFGTGLNCLNVLDLWHSLGPKGNLNYLAFEGYPLQIEEFNHALELFDKSDEIKQSLIHGYPTLLQSQSVSIKPNVRVELEICDVDTLLIKTKTWPPFDVIFMDGFSPANNPDMWSK